MFPVIVNDESVMAVLDRKEIIINKAKKAADFYMSKVVCHQAESDSLIRNNLFFLPQVFNYYLGAFIVDPMRELKNLPDVSEVDTDLITFFSNSYAARKFLNENRLVVPILTKPAIMWDAVIEIFSEDRKNKLLMLADEFQDYTDVTDTMPFFFPHIYHYDSQMSFFNDNLVDDTFAFMFWAYKQLYQSNDPADLRLTTNMKKLQQLSVQANTALKNSKLFTEKELVKEKGIANCFSKFRNVIY